MLTMSVQYHAPSNHQDFERLMKSLFEEEMNAVFERYGRSGQNQKGIDIFGLQNGKPIILQCKCYDQTLVNKKTTEKEVNEIVQAIENNYSNQFEKIYILHTRRNDQKITDYVIQLNEKRGNEKPQIILWGWDEISDRINSSTKTKAMLSQQSSESNSSKSYLIKAFISTSLVISVYFGYEIYQSYKSSKIQNSTVTIKYLDETSKQVEQLKNAYIHCVETASGFLYLNSDQLQEKCVEPISKQEHILAQLQNQYAASVDSATYDKIKRLNDNLAKLSFDTYAAIQMSRSLENNMVRNFEATVNNQDKRLSEDIIKESSKNAFNFQMYAYFRNRDFNIPILSSTYASIANISRNIRHDAIPSTVSKQAEQLQSLIDKRNAYAYRDYPTNISQVKTVMSSDTTHDNGIILSDNEMLSIRAMSLLVGMKNSPRFIDQLIESGQVKPEIKAHFANKKEFNPTLALETNKF